VLAVLLLACSVVADERPLMQLPYTPSLDVAAMDKAADPCVDFYQYACGGWVAKNPIPPDQASWSVYGKLAEENSQFLWAILEEAAKPEAGRTPVQQKIGDYFAACMDEPRIESLGAKPLRPLLSEIAELRTKAELARFLAAEHPRSYGSGWLFGFGADQDYGDATQVIAFASAGGLGLPDRDYYTKTDAKSQEIRAKYVAHVMRMLRLIGEPRAQAARDVQAVMRIETALATASLTRVEKRDPYNLYHKMTPAQLAALASFDWKRYLSENGLAGVATLNVTEPAGRLLRQRDPRRRLRVEPPAREDRQAGRSRRVGDDAAHRQRLLQRADERHQLPGGRAPAAALRSAAGRGAQLWQHRLDHRPRADHAFDDEGRKFESQGNLKDWWTAEDAKAFEERVQCVRDQYAQYTVVDDIKINSKLTSGEDVADLGGTLLAYIAWKDAFPGATR
jgi:predicted metalloendopeptidase